LRRLLAEARLGSRLGVVCDTPGLRHQLAPPAQRRDQRRQDARPLEKQQPQCHGQAGGYARADVQRGQDLELDFLVLGQRDGREWGHPRHARHLDVVQAARQR